MHDGRLDPTEHSRLPWRITEVAPDFDLIDAWALPAEGELSEFADLRTIFADLDPGTDRASAPSRALFAARHWLGACLGWDEEVNSLPIPGSDELSLRDRLPPDLEADTSETAGRMPFRPIYLTDTEWALELSNSTVHAIVHLGWVSTGGTRYRGQMGVYVKPRGRFGGTYMVLIAPFRHYFVYPALLRRVEHEWSTRTDDPVDPATSSKQ
jgi:hypothetical protein